MSVEVDVPSDVVVVRFSPVQEDRVLARWLDDYIEHEHYGLSVFAAAAEPGETAEATEERLIAVAHSDGIGWPRKYYVASAGTLTMQGLRFAKSGDPQELHEHYCVILDEREPDLMAVRSFLDAFAMKRRRIT